MSVRPQRPQRSPPCARRRPACQRPLARPLAWPAGPPTRGASGATPPRCERQEEARSRRGAPAPAVGDRGRAAARGHPRYRPGPRGAPSPAPPHTRGWSVSGAGEAHSAGARGARAPRGRGGPRGAGGGPHGPPTSSGGPGPGRATARRRPPARAGPDGRRSVRAGGLRSGHPRQGLPPSQAHGGWFVPTLRGRAGAARPAPLPPALLASPASNAPCAGGAPRRRQHPGARARVTPSGPAHEARPGGDAPGVTLPQRGQRRRGRDRRPRGGGKPWALVASRPPAPSLRIHGHDGRAPQRAGALRQRVWPPWPLLRRAALRAAGLAERDVGGPWPLGGGLVGLLARPGSRAVDPLGAPLGEPRVTLATRGRGERLPHGGGGAGWLARGGERARTGGQPCRLAGGMHQEERGMLRGARGAEPAGHAARRGRRRSGGAWGPRSRVGRRAARASTRGWQAVNHRGGC